MLTHGHLELFIFNAHKRQYMPILSLLRKLLNFYSLISLPLHQDHSEPKPSGQETIHPENAPCADNLIKFISCVLNRNPVWLRERPSLWQREQ